MLHGTKPDSSKLRAFGEACEVSYTPAARIIDNGDMHPRTVPGILVGYDHETGSKGYLLFVPSWNKIVSLDQVKFLGFQATINGRTTSHISDMQVDIPPKYVSSTNLEDNTRD